MSRHIFVLMATAAVLLLASGCTTNIERIDSAAPSVSPSSQSEPVASSAPEPAAAAGSHEERLKTVEQLEAAYRQNPDDGGAKAKLIAAKYEYASRLMEDPDVPPRQKYRPALKAFNEILALEPGHKEAAARKKIIEDIYRSMGMPVPG
jgi:hypothetical protein